MRTSGLLSSFLALSLSSFVSVEGRLFGFLRRDNDEEASSSSSTMNADEAGDVGVFLTNHDMKVGRRGLACLQYAANVENDPFGDLGVLAGAMTRVLLTYFGEDGLNMVCASTYRGRKLLAEELGEEAPVEEIGNYSTPSETRRVQSCAATTASYPTDPAVDKENTYNDYSSKYYAQFFPSGNLEKRSDTPTVIEQIENEIAYLNEVGAGLSTCSNIWSMVNQGIGIIDIPFVDPEKMSEAIQAFSCDLANDYNDIVISRKMRDLERLTFHDQLIDSAEIQAGYENTKTILEDICSVSSSMTTLKLEMEVIDASV